MKCTFRLHCWASVWILCSWKMGFNRDWPWQRIWRGMRWSMSLLTWKRTMVDLINFILYLQNQFYFLKSLGNVAFFRKTWNTVIFFCRWERILQLYDNFPWTCRLDEPRLFATVCLHSCGQVQCSITSTRFEKKLLLIRKYVSEGKNKSLS